MSFELKGSSTGRTKIDWPLRVIGRVIQLSQTGKGAKEAFAIAVEEHNGVEANAPITLPVSYTNNNAGSVLWGMKKRFSDRLNKEDKATIEVAKEFGLLKETSAAV
jgi:hypothetical protein